MKRGRIAGAAAAVLALAAGAAWLVGRGRRPPLEFSGTIEARDAQVGSLVGGRISRVLVDEGARVTKGQPLVLLEADLLDRQIAQERGNVTALRANLEKMVAGPRREEVARAETDWRTAEKTRQRSAALLAQGLQSQQQYDLDAAQAKMLREAYQELARGNRPEDIAQARAQLAAEEARLAYLLQQREELTVRAPADGVIETMDLRSGDLAAPGQGIIAILEPGQIWVRIYVPEPRLGLVRRGQRASISVDTFPGKTYSGRVVEIREQAEYTPRNVQTLEERGDEVFGVKVAIDPSPDLKPGMAALVRLER